jgi:signal transduction histidine kinase
VQTTVWKNLLIKKFGYFCFWVNFLQHLIADLGYDLKHRYFIGVYRGFSWEIINSGHRYVQHIIIVCLLICLNQGYANTADSLKTAMLNAPVSEKLSVFKSHAETLLKGNRWIESYELYKEMIALLEADSVLAREEFAVHTDILLQLSYIHLIYKAEYNQSLGLLHQVVNRSEKQNDTLVFIKANKLLGFNYRFLSKYEKSIEHLEIAIAYSRIRKDTSNLLMSLNEKANVLYFLGQYSQSEKLHYEALALAKQINDEYNINCISHDLGFLFMHEKDFRKALRYFLFAFHRDLSDENHRDMCISACNIADVYLQLDQVDSSRYYYKFADSLVKNQALRTEALNVFYGFSNLYEKLGDYSLALKYKNEYLVLKDSIFNTEKERQIAEINAKYESDKKERENALLKQQNQIQVLELEKGRVRLTYTVLIFIAVFTFIGIISLILFQGNKKIRKINRELEEANTSKDKFFSIIAHDIKNPFQSILGFSNLLENDFENFSRDELKKMASMIAESSESLLKLLENLLQWSRAQSNRLEISPEYFPISEVIEANVALYKNPASRKNIQIAIDTDPSVQVYADREMIDFVVRNLLSNAVKFTRPEGKIAINTSRSKHKIIIGVIDNGIGISSQNIDKLFSIESEAKISGTDNEQGTGLGLIVCKEFVDKNGGEIWVESDTNTGSKFYFSIPLKG